jgi:superfamily II DNA helicase RecQ
MDVEPAEPAKRPRKSKSSLSVPSALPCPIVIDSGSEGESIEQTAIAKARSHSQSGRILRPSRVLAAPSAPAPNSSNALVSQRNVASFPSRKRNSQTFKPDNTRSGTIEPVESSPAGNAPPCPPGDLDAVIACYEELRQLRDKMISEGRASTPAAIFPNSVLQGLAKRMPCSITSFMSVQDVTDEKYNLFGSEFLNITKRYAAKRKSQYF